MTNIGNNINVGKSYQIQDVKQPEKECCSVCGECHDEPSVDDTDLNKAPGAVIGQSLVNKKGPYKFDPAKVESDVKAFMKMTEAMEENQKFADDFKRELEASYINEGMSEGQADHFSSIAARCLLNPTTYNR